MDVIKGLYDIYSESKETEKLLLRIDKELLEYIESNFPNGEKALFYDMINSVMKKRDEYFFKAGFEVAKTIFLNKHDSLVFEKVI